MPREFSDAERHLFLEEQRKALAPEKLLAFCRYMMPSYVVARHHRLIAHKLQQVEDGTIRRLMVTLPPQHGKSALVSRMFPAWFIGRNPSLRGLTIGYGEDFALANYGRPLRNLLLNDKYPQVFPGVQLTKDAQAAGEWSTTQEGGWRVVGAGGQITGNTAHVVLIDDPLKGRDEANSQPIRDSIWDWFWSDVWSRLNPFKDGPGAVVLCCTRWHDDDIAGRFLRQMEKGGESWDVLSLPALAEDHDPLGRARGEALWPEKYPREYLEMYRDLRPRDFNALYQQKPVPDEGERFKTDWLRYYDDLPLHLRLYGASDYATKTNDGDYTVHLVAGMCPDGNLYIVDLWREQASSEVWVEAAIDLMAKHRVVKWAEERGQILGGVGPFLEKRMRERHVYRVREQFSVSKDKMTRTTAIAGMLQAGRVYLPARASWRADFEYELSRFPSGKFDDQVDALALLGRMLEKMHGGQEARAVAPTGIMPASFTFQDKMKRARARRHGMWVSREAPVIPFVADPLSESYVSN